MALTEIEAEFRREDLAVMDPVALLAEAEAGGLNVFADGDRIVVRGPKNAEHDLVTALLNRKPELMPVLRAFAAEEQERFEERAAIAEHDGKLSRAEAEQVARAHLSQPPGPGP